jgi:opacity protein-like surface antigen
MRTRRALWVIAAVISGMLVSAGPAQAQDRIGLQASVGPVFGNVGTTVAASGSADLALSDRFALVGEVGALPHAPFRDADEIAAPLPGLVGASDFHVNGYHANANLRWRPAAESRLMPYVTGGVGTFVADTIGSATRSDVFVQERHRQTDLATNLGGGITFRLNDWIGLNGDYRTFFVHRDDDTRRVNRFTLGFNLFLK